MVEEELMWIRLKGNVRNEPNTGTWQFFEVNPARGTLTQVIFFYPGECVPISSSVIWRLVHSSRVVTWDNTTPSTLESCALFQATLFNSQSVNTSGQLNFNRRPITVNYSPINSTVVWGSTQSKGGFRFPKRRMVTEGLGLTQVQGSLQGYIQVGLVCNAQNFFLANTLSTHSRKSYW